VTHTDDAVTAPPRFSDRIREATWGDHSDAEHSSFMEELMGKRLDRAQYAEMVVQMWFVYRELEAHGARLSDDAVVAPFLDSGLLRTDRIAGDLDVLLGEGWIAAATPTAETQEYVDRLAEVGTTWPSGYVAHHYTRYLGDLSGGQFIGKVVRSIYDLTDDEGAAFYRFPDIHEPGAWKESYRRRLDEMDLDADEEARVIAEIRKAYRLNTALLAGLGQRVLGRR
jgi:heme oxygenase